MPINQNKIKTQAGFSLTEVVIALFIFIVMLLLYVAASNTLRLNKYIKSKDLALRIAVSSMEDLKNTSFVSLPVSGNLNHPQLNLLKDATIILTMVDINANLKEARIVVNWKDETDGTARSLNLSSLLSDKGI